ncbi:MAG: GIY-YIG nuclease family protein [Candidatus Omnitrophica bacterium]|nr:GIY-YIG nuclease family protein [Candidatus Omnitrophota bacterium]
MWHVYMLQCVNGSLYTGITTDLVRRLHEHNDGQGGAYTRAHRPVKLIYQEFFRDRSAAQRRECEIKSWPRTKKESFLLQNA